MYTLYFDGSCVPKNPGGHMGCGVIIKDVEGRVIKTLRKQILSYDIGGKTSNNLAEYLALNMGLIWCLENNINHLKVKGDSLMVINQMLGSYKIKSGLYVEVAKQTKELIKKFQKITFQHIIRDLNTEADSLSSVYLNGREVKGSYRSKSVTHSIKENKKNNQQPKPKSDKIRKLSFRDSTDPIKVSQFQDMLKKRMEEILPKRAVELTSEEWGVKKQILREGHIRRETKSSNSTFTFSQNNRNKKRNPPKGGWV